MDLAYDTGRVCIKQSWNLYLLVMKSVKRDDQ